MVNEADLVNDLDQIRSRYHLLRPFGRDGSFALHAVRAKDSDRHYLLKVIDAPGPLRTSADKLHSWQAHTVKALDHPKLMVLHAVHHLQGGAVAIAMDRRRGRTLADLLESEGPLPASRIEHILRDVAEALAYLHDRGVVHRGVRPESIFLDSDCGHARLCFFGIDRLPDPSGANGETAPLIRVFSYLAPEQIAGREQVDGRRLSPRSDLYSLGLVGRAMLTGRPAWTGDTLDALLKKRKQQPLGALEEARPDVPVPLREAIEGCLERRARNRWKSAQEFISRLNGDDPPASEAAANRGNSIRTVVQEKLTAVPTFLGRRIEGVDPGKLAAVTIAIVIGILTFGALRGDDDAVARGEGEVPLRSSTVLELPPSVPPPAESVRDADIPNPAPVTPRSTGAPSRGPANAAGSVPSVDLPSRSRGTPQRVGPGQNFAASGRIVLLGEPLAESIRGALGDAASRGADRR